MTARVASWVLYGIVAAVFGYAAVIKIVDPKTFLSSLMTFELFPRSVAAALSLYAPILELLLALCLLTGLWRRSAVWLTALLLVVFVLLIAQARARGLAIDCGCFGSNRVESAFDYVWKIGENLLLLAALLGARALERASAAKSRTN